MIDLRAFEPNDLAALKLQPQQEMEMGALPGWRELGEMCHGAGPAWTGLIDGRPVGCAGFAVHFGGRAECWCFLSDDIPRRAWVSLHRAVASRVRQLQVLGVHRVEASTAVGWLPGRRWLEMLGFECEGVMRAYGPDRRDFFRFARVLA
jgi:RimJ/RimL family protein N-acetyltransferase